MYHCLTQVQFESGSRILPNPATLFTMNLQRTGTKKVSYMLYLKQWEEHMSSLKLTYPGNRCHVVSPTNRIGVLGADCLSHVFGCFGCFASSFAVQSQIKEGVEFIRGSTLLKKIALRKGVCSDYFLSTKGEEEARVTHLPLLV
jgi:hypothetical protein